MFDGDFLHEGEGSEGFPGVRWKALGIVLPHIPSAGLYSDSVARYTAFKLKRGPP